MPRIVGPGEAVEKNISSRLNEEDAREFKVVCYAMGLNDSNAVRAAIKDFIRKFKRDNPQEFLEGMEHVKEKESEKKKPRRNTK